MKIVLFISFFVLSTISNAQFGNRNLFFRSSQITPPAEGFNWDNLTPQGVTVYNNHSGTTTIENKSFTNLNPNDNFGSSIGVYGGSGTIILRKSYLGASIGEAIQFENFNGTIIIEDCLFANNKNGVFIAGGTVNLTIQRNQFVNPNGARRGKGQAIQLSGVSAAGGIVYDNQIESFRGEGYTEDLISIFNSQGASGNHIIVSNNLARGGGPSPSGGGFIAGDGNGGYTTIENNKLKDPGNYILAAAGGSNVVIRNNLGYQSSFPWLNIATYSYITDASSFCNNITIQGNSVFIPNGNTYYSGDATEKCGDVIGIGPGGDQEGFLETNSDDLTLAELAFPTTIIDYVTEDRLWHIRDESVPFQIYVIQNGWPASLPRPTANAGPDQSIGLTTATLDGSGSTSTDGNNYTWAFVSGPTTPTIVSPFSVSTNITGMSVSGVYEFRLVDTNNSGAGDADWVSITVTLL